MYPPPPASCAELHRVVGDSLQSAKLGIRLPQVMLFLSRILSVTKRLNECRRSGMADWIFHA
jgi:hypothetical protein